MNINLGYQTKVKTGFYSVTLPDEEIKTITFSSPVYELDELVIVACNGDHRIKSKTKTPIIDISSLLYAGVLEMSVHLIANGQPVKKWDIVPIILREVDNSLCAFDEIEELRARVADLEKKTTVIV